MIRLILLTVILVLAASYFGISLKNIVDSPVGQENIQFVWGLLITGWTYLSHFIQNFIGLHFTY